MTVTNFSHQSGKLHKKMSKISVLAPTLGQVQEAHSTAVLMCQAAFVAICTYTVFVISHITQNVIQIQDPTVPVLQPMHLYPVVWILHKRRK